jgi:tetratricopeptide (TPR) repeat protein
MLSAMTRSLLVPPAAAPLRMAAVEAAATGHGMRTAASPMCKAATTQSLPLSRAPRADGGLITPTTPVVRPVHMPSGAASEMNASALYEQAQVLLQTHRLKEAVGVLNKLTELTPDDGRVWMKLMSTHKRAKRMKLAEATVRKGIAALPENGRLRQALADLCRESKRFGEARRHFREAMRHEPRLASVYDSWGRMEASLGKHALAASLFERGLELRPTSRLCHAYGVLLDKQGLSDRARETLRRGLNLPDESSNPQLLHALGMVEVRAGNHGKARMLFQSAIKDHPSFTLAHLALGQLEERLGNKAAARRYYEAGATAKQRAGQPAAVQLWQSWARMEQRLGSPYKLVQSLYKRASVLFPEDDHLLIEWGKLASEHDNEALARKLFAQVIRRKGSAATPYVFKVAAALEARVGHAERARKLFEAGVSAGSAAAAEELMPLLHAWAVFEWRQGDRHAARDLFHRAEEKAADDKPCAWLYQWRANFEAEGGNLLLARHYYSRAVNAAPHDSSAWRLWAELEAEYGDAERADVLSRHARVVDVETTLLDAVGTRRGGKQSRSPLDAADLYNKRMR